MNTYQQTLAKLRREDGASLFNNSNLADLQKASEIIWVNCPPPKKGRWDFYFTSRLGLIAYMYADENPCRESIPVTEFLRLHEEEAQPTEAKGEVKGAAQQGDNNIPTFTEGYDDIAFDFHKANGS